MLRRPWHCSFVIGGRSGDRSVAAGGCRHVEVPERVASVDDKTGRGSRSWRHAGAGHAENNRRSVKGPGYQAFSGHAEAWRIPRTEATPVDGVSAGANQMVKAVPRSSETTIDLG